MCSSITWRAAIVEFLHKHYFQHNSFYNIVHVDKRIDNPDQRMTEAVTDFCDGTCNLMFGSFFNPVGFVTNVFMMILSLSLLFQTGWLGPAAAGVSTLVLVLVTQFLVGKISRLTFLQDNFEGTLRFLHGRVRQFAETIAFYAGEVKEHDAANSQFESVFRNYLALIWNTFGLFYNQAVWYNICPLVFMCMSYFFLGRICQELRLTGSASST